MLTPQTPIVSDMWHISLFFLNFIYAHYILWTPVFLSAREGLSESVKNNRGPKYIKCVIAIWKVTVQNITLIENLPHPSKKPIFLTSFLNMNSL